MRLYIREILLTAPLPADSYLCAIPAVAHLQNIGSLRLHAPVTFFVGENGAGKSTLLEAIAVSAGFNPEGGSRNFRFSTRNTHAALWQHLTLAKGAPAADGFFLRAESMYAVASYIDDLDSIPAAAPPVISAYGGVSLHRQSHGESFLSLVQHRFSGNGIYILDEPEAALSPQRQLTLLIELQRLVQAGAQFLIATHSPLLMAFPGAEILELSAAGIQPTAYTETTHYQITRAFLNDPDSMLHALFENK